MKDLSESTSHFSMTPMAAALVFAVLRLKLTGVNLTPPACQLELGGEDDEVAV